MTSSIITKYYPLDSVFLNWGSPPLRASKSRKRGEYGSDMLLKSRILANKLFCFFVFEFEVRRGASMND